MAKLNEKQKILAAAGAGVLLCLAAGGGIYWADGLVTEKRAAIDNDRKQVQAARAKIDKVAKLEEDVIILRENVDNYTRILPSQTEVNEFVRTIQTFIEQSGVLPQRTSKGSDGKRGKYSHYSYNLELTGTLWQFLRFVNLFENHDRFVRVVDFEVKPAKADDVDRMLLAGQDPVHGYRLEIETYVYNGESSDGEFEISKYPQKRDRLMSEIERGRDVLALESYQLSEEIGRRDIFVDPRPRLGGLSIGNDGVQERILQEFIAEIVELQELFAKWEAETIYLTRNRMEGRLREELTAIDERATASSAKMVSEKRRQAWERDVLSPIRDMWKSLDGVGIDQPSGITLARLDAVEKEMRDLVKRGDFEAAVALHEELEDRLTFDREDDRFEAALRLTTLRLAIEAAIDFKEIPLERDGVVAYQDGRRGLLLNNTCYEEGEMVREDLMLKSVGVEEAQFVFRGHLLIKRW